MHEKKKNDAITRRIDILSESLGYEKEDKHIFTMQRDPETKRILLDAQNGEWQTDEPIFIHDKENEDKLYVALDAHKAAAILQALQESTRENFHLKLEKAIWKHTPVDFQDVWVVAMEKIKEKAAEESQGASTVVNLDDLIADIKREHPQLFVDLSALFSAAQQ